MKPGDKVYIYTADLKTFRGEAIVERHEGKEMVVVALPAGTQPGDFIAPEPLPVTIPDWQLHCTYVQLDGDGRIAGLKREGDSAPWNRRETI